MARAVGALATAVSRQHRRDEADALNRNSLARYGRSLGMDHPKLGVLEAALRIGETLPERALFRAETKFTLAQVLWERNGRGDRKHAVSLAESARELFSEHQPDCAAEVRRWLGEHH